jgi:putative ABC transport system permease protein
VQARDAMDRLAREIEAEHPDLNRGHGAWVTPLREELVGPVSASLVALFAAVGLVLLIACVNVVNLQLARGAGRRREMAVRSALGAGRARLIVQGLAEHLALATAGGVAALVVAWTLLAALPFVLPEQMSVVGIRDVGIDARVVLFALGITVAAAVLVGLLPAIAASRPSVIDLIKSAGRGAPVTRRRARTALVIVEVALASLTLVGGGLVLRSFAAILAQPLGFETANRLTFGISVPSSRYKTVEARRIALDAIEQKIAALPGVVSVGAINLPPLGGGDSRTGVGIEGFERRDGDPPTRMHPRTVTPGYFATMSIPIVQGRGFTAHDGTAAEPVVVINQTAVRRFFPDRSPIGVRLQFGGDNVLRTIVGVVGDVRHWGLTLETNPMVYMPQSQSSWSLTTFVLRTNGDPLALTGAARARVAEVDPLLPLASVRTYDEILARSVQSQRAQTLLMGAFGVLALALAVVGIYGVTSQLVAARVPEIGVRMTLGARPRDVLRQILGEGLWQAIAGVMIGITAGAFLMRFAQSLLFNVTPWDPLTLAVVAVLLVAAAVAACVGPARRAMRIDPAAALRG